MSTNFESSPQKQGKNSVSRPMALFGIASAFLLGIAGTSLMQKHGSAPASNIPAHDKPETTSPLTGEKSTLIKLDASAIQTAGIRSEAAKSTLMGETLTVSGTVEVSPNSSAKITPPVSGKVVALLVKPGDKVVAGQPLAHLDCYELSQARAAVVQAQSGVLQAEAAVRTARAETAQYQSSINQAKSEIERAQARQKAAEAALKRQKELAEAGSYSQAPLQAAQAEYVTAQSELLQANISRQAHATALQRAERLFNEELVSRAELEQAQIELRQSEAISERTRSRSEAAKQALNREQKVFSADLLNKQALQSVESEVRETVADVQRARQALMRAEQDLHRAQSGEQAALAALQGARAASKSTQMNLLALTGDSAAEAGGMITLRAPFSGVITDRKATQGEAVERGATLLLLENLQDVQVVANLPEGQMAAIQAGARVRVKATNYPGRVFPGVVTGIGEHIDEKSRTLPVRCLVDNQDGSLRPGMFTEVSIGIGAHSGALVVPNSAIEQDATSTWVYVEAQGGYERRSVQIGRVTVTSTEIIKGLKPGERIAVDGLFVLKSEANKDKLKGED